jgi:hypothetical protein
LGHGTVAGDAKASPMGAKEAACSCCLVLVLDFIHVKRIDRVTPNIEKLGPRPMRLVLVAVQISTAAARLLTMPPAGTGQHSSPSPLAPLLSLRERLSSTLTVKIRLPQWHGVGESSGSTRPVMRSAEEVENFVADATSGANSWAFAVHQNGFTVWKRKLPGSPHVYVRGHGIFDAPPSSVVALFESSDADFIRQYNPMYDSGWDLERYDATTKAAYGKVRAAAPGVRPRDTVSLISRRCVRGGGVAFFQDAMVHPAAPPLRGVVRAKILRGMFLIQSVPGSTTRTNFTFCQQVDAGGVIPAWVMNRLITGEAISFLQRLERTARCS